MILPVECFSLELLYSCVVCDYKQRRAACPTEYPPTANAATYCYTSKTCCICLNCYQYPFE